jgi:hypothetical protein
MMVLLAMQCQSFGSTSFGARNTHSERVAGVDGGMISPGRMKRRFGAGSFNNGVVHAPLACADAGVVRKNVCAL